MNEIIEKAYAKINLGLDILNKRKDGYHEVKMIMQTIDLFDVLQFVKTSKNINIVCNNPKLSLDKTNIVYKAVKLIKKEYNISENVFVNIQKNIPISAGLGGGSADAAATIRAMNTLFNLNLADDRLEELGLILGADVPFLITGGTALAKGIGEKLKKLPKLPELTLLLAKPDIDVSTREVYAAFDKLENVKHPRIDDFINSSDKILSPNRLSLLGNVLEGVTINKHKIISRIKEDMLREGALYSMMTGSGPTVFGIFKTEEEIRPALKKFRSHKEFEMVQVVKTFNT